MPNQRLRFSRTQTAEDGQNCITVRRAQFVYKVVPSPPHLGALQLGKARELFGGGGGSFFEKLRRKLLEQPGQTPPASAIIGLLVEASSVHLWAGKVCLAVMLDP